jgi:hypothetical protein
LEINGLISSLFSKINVQAGSWKTIKSQDLQGSQNLKSFLPPDICQMVLSKSPTGQRCTKVSCVMCFLCWPWILLLARIFLVDHATKPLTKILLWPQRWHGFSNCRMPLHRSFPVVGWFEWQWTLCKVYLKLDSSEIVSDLFCWERERSLDTKCTYCKQWHEQWYKRLCYNGPLNQTITPA